MGGGSGAGLFEGTAGARDSNALSGGKLLPTAAQFSPAADAESRGIRPSGVSWESIWDLLRPWWSRSYDHPEKKRRMAELQGMLQPRLEGMARGFLSMDNRDPKNALIAEFAEALSRMFGSGNRKRAEEKK